MKFPILFLIALCFFSCKKESGVCTEITLGENIELNHDTLVCIDDVEYTFQAKDERCCCGCVCVWEGEFVLTFLNSADEVIYTFHQATTVMENGAPPFGESMEIISITNQEPDCGDDSKIDDVRFTIVVN